MEIRGLPFSFTVDGDPTTGARAEFGLRLALPIDDLAFDQLRCVVSWYAKLGALGGLGGLILPPSRVTAVLGNGGEPNSRGPQPTWIFDRLCVDPRSLVILANLVFATGLHVQRAWLRTTGLTFSDAYAPDDYPQAYHQIPFAVNDSRTDRNVQITIEFVSDVPDVQHKPITDRLRIWSLVGALGGFRCPGVLRDKLDLLPEDDPEIILDELKFCIRDDGLHDAAYSLLTNLLIQLAESVIGITQLSIQ